MNNSSQVTGAENFPNQPQSSSEPSIFELSALQQVAHALKELSNQQ